jgi:hypothetical protein
MPYSDRAKIKMADAIELAIQDFFLNHEGEDWPEASFNVFDEYRFSVERATDLEVHVKAKPDEGTKKRTRVFTVKVSEPWS